MTPVNTVARALLLVLAAAPALAQADRSAHVGYVYPAGGQVGTTFRITVGGQFLKDMTEVHVSGGGVAGELVEYVKPLNRQEAGYATRMIYQHIRAKQAEKAGKPVPPIEEDPDRPPLPDHPLIRGMADMPIPELERVRNALNDPKRQPNVQIDEQVILDLTLAPDAEPGDRELRLVGATGMSNPLCFQVDILPEILEDEPLGVQAPAHPAVDLPVILNGQVMPGDLDQFRFRARRGQQLVVRAAARKLVPYLADAVPGWFQATLALYNADRAELTFVDDYCFDPDPVLFYVIPETGEYELEIRDSIYRGREDFVYRISVGEQPFILSMFPLGGRQDSEVTAAIGGWNLLTQEVPLDLTPGATTVRETFVKRGTGRSNEVPYEIGELPELNEHEPNDSDRDSQRVELPRVINGVIGAPGDVDTFIFRGKQGDEVVAEVSARRLRSPLDSLLRLLDARGTVVAWNDDHKDPALGLLTHHADSYVRATLPADGDYRVQLSDAQRQGNEMHAYRLRISAPQPDFTLRCTPSGLTVPGGRVAAITVHAIRRDDYAGPIEIRLADAPAGFALSGGWMPPGKDKVRLTLTVPDKAPPEPVPIRLEGLATLDGRTVRRAVVPAEDMMQAFIWWHVVPCQELLVRVTSPTIPAPAGELASAGPIPIPMGGTAAAKVTLPAKPVITGVQFVLSEPPAGVTLGKVAAVDDGLVFPLNADPDKATVGAADNLIIEVYSVQGRRTFLGLVPAIPIEIVAP